MLCRRWVLGTIILSTVVQGYGKVEWKSKRVQLRAAPGESSAVAEFAYTNRGPDDVLISGLKTSCSCTIPTLKNKLIRVGEGGVLSTRFEFGPREGLQRKAVNVIYAGGETERLELEVDIPVVYMLSTARLFWAKDEGRRPKTVQLTNISKRPLVLQNIVVSSPGFKGELVEVKPGLRYDVRITPPSDEGIFRTMVSVEFPATDGGKPRRYRIYAVTR